MRNTRPASVSAMRRPIRSNSFVSCRASSAAIAWLTAMVGKRFGRGFALEQGGGHKFDPQEYETLAIAPHSQRHVCQILWLARSLFLQSRRMSPFRRPVSAAENSVPDSRIRRLWFDPCVGGSQFGPDRLHHPVAPNRRNLFCSGIVGFSGDFRQPRSAFSVSADTFNFLKPVLASGLRIEKFRSRRRPFEPTLSSLQMSEPGPQLSWTESEGFKLSGPLGDASRSRSTPMPRGKHLRLQP